MNSTSTKSKNEPWQMNFVVVGEERCGKTKLIERYLRREFSDRYKKTGIEQFTASIKVASKPARLNIWDFGGHISLSDLHAQTFLNSANVLMYCYDLTKPIDIQHLDERLGYFSDNASPHCFVFLVGCKLDARELPVTGEEENTLNKLADRCSAKSYMVSSKTDVGVTPLFLDAIRFSYSVHLEEKQLRMRQEMELAQQSEKRSFWLRSHVIRGDTLSDLYSAELARKGSVDRLFLALEEKLETHDSAVVAHVKTEENLLFLVNLAFTDLNVKENVIDLVMSVIQSRTEIVKTAISDSDAVLQVLFGQFVNFARRRAKEAKKEYNELRKKSLDKVEVSSPRDKRLLNSNKRVRGRLGLGAEMLKPRSPLQPNDIERIRQRGGSSTEPNSHNTETYTTPTNRQRKEGMKVRKNSDGKDEVESLFLPLGRIQSDSSRSKSPTIPPLKPTAKVSPLSHSDPSLSFGITATDTTAEAVSTPRYRLSPREESLKQFALSRSHGPLSKAGFSDSERDEPIESSSNLELLHRREDLLLSLLSDLFDAQPYRLIGFLIDNSDYAHSLALNLDSQVEKVLTALFRAELNLFILEGNADRRTLFDVLLLYT